MARWEKHAAGVLAIDDIGPFILAVTRYPHVKGANSHHVDWGLPGGWQQTPGERPIETAQRELYEETHLRAKLEPTPLIIVPPEITGNGKPYYVFVPGPEGLQGPINSPVYNSPVRMDSKNVSYLYAHQHQAITSEGWADWITVKKFMQLKDPSVSVLDSNRYILRWGLGWNV